MNIFVLHKDPKKCARMHCDKHIVKMPVETAQILSTVHHINDSKFKDKVYKSIKNPGHPWVEWASKSSDNYQWAYNIFLCLCDEYERRYKKKYKSSELSDYLRRNPSPKGGMTEMPLCMPDEYKTEDPVESYRNYYLGEKLGFAEWKFSETPEFVKRYMELKNND